MSKINITINNMSFAIVCQDGEEEHAYHLAQMVDSYFVKIGNHVDISRVGDVKLMAMVAMIICDELLATQKTVQTLERKIEGYETTLNTSMHTIQTSEQLTSQTLTEQQMNNKLIEERINQAIEKMDSLVAQFDHISSITSFDNTQQKNKQ